MKKKPVKERIIETALIMFEQHGYHGVTVDQIVDECGTSKGGFYHNFKSKDELLYHIHDVFISYLLNKAKESHDKETDPVSRLCAIITSFTRIFDLYKPHITVFYQESTYLKGDFEERINEKRDEYRKLLLQVIRDGQSTGDFRQEVPAEISTMAIMGIINWMYKWFKKDGELSIETIARIFNDMMIHSLLTEEAMKSGRGDRFLLKTEPV
ncbi:MULTISPECIES: TetR/AcrR family transcriptional regulator [Bacillaceae]|uniref:TetR family transcriptional regulator n=1 Tax=Domibacillus aminovorans TaxID=29332 RepID=A0A177KMP1_9BACI|nr:MULTISPECIES: TetR/AcrR family transcriptional regulator [Bacillaceae]OAH53841.1 TetR family transcriptional regulator [Domibacillus aminovorans]